MSTAQSLTPTQNNTQAETPVHIVSLLWVERSASDKARAMVRFVRLLLLLRVTKC